MGDLTNGWPGNLFLGDRPADSLEQRLMGLQLREREAIAVRQLDRPAFAGTLASTLSKAGTIEFWAETKNLLLLACF